MLNRVKESKAWAFYTRWRLPLNLAVLLLLFFVNCFWGGMVFIVYPVLLALVCFDNFANAVSYLVAALPFIALNGVLGYLFYLLCLLALVIKFYATVWLVDKLRPRPAILIVIGLFIIYCLLPIGPYNNNLWSKTAYLLAIFIMLGVIICKPAIVRLRLNIRLLSITLLLSGLMACLRPFSPYLSSVITPIYSNDWLRFSALYVHPNALAMMCMLLVALFVYLIVSRQTKLSDYLLMFALTAMGLATISKNCLVVMAVAYVIIFIYLLRRNWAPTVVVGLVVLGVAIGFCCTNNALVSYYFGRFVEGWSAGDGFTAFMNDLTTYRYELWVNYCTYLWQNPLVLFFGAGLGAGPVLLPREYLYPQSPHNFFLAMVYQLGLVGSALFITAVVLLIIDLKRRHPQLLRRAIWVPLLIYLLPLLVEDFILFIPPVHNL